MNKKYLKENNLYEAHKHFMELCEWTYMPSQLEEDDDDENPDDNAGQGNMNDDSMEGQDGNMSSDDGEIMGGQEDMQPSDGQMPNQGPNDGGQEDGMPVGDGMPMDGGIPMDGDVDPIGDDGEEDDVIDVDDITNAQEKTNDKVNLVGRDLGQVDDKITALMTAIDKMEKMINANNDNIADFKQEFEKRNPTQVEKLNLRSLDSYPFNVNPKDYWTNKGIDDNSNYSGEFDNDKDTTDEFVVTNDDVDNFDEREIQDSFSVDDELNQDIKKIFGL